MESSAARMTFALHTDMCSAKRYKRSTPVSCITIQIHNCNICVNLPVHFSMLLTFRAE